jgi:hypothetical protein
METLSGAIMGSMDGQSDDGESWCFRLEILPGLKIQDEWLDTIRDTALKFDVKLFKTLVEYSAPFMGISVATIKIDVDIDVEGDSDDEAFVGFCDAIWGRGRAEVGAAG